MTTPDHLADGPDAAAVAYEQLRSHALAGSPFGRDIGWVLLLRAGVATWIDRCVAGIAPAAPSAAGDHVGAVTLVSEPLHVGVVHVLASIALSRREAVSP
ncbi:MAG: hypothetical protein HY729_14720 [Candidatus Rokubacteria bacterium]|nr:hypothetical protein [Candidatus Rokubacteria bacterium]